MGLLISADTNQARYEPSEKTTLSLLKTLCVAQLVLWTLAPILLLKNSYYDILENLVWGRHWQFGYDKDPYFIPWLTETVSKIFGGTIWPAYLLSQVAIVIAYFSVYKLSRQMKLSPAHSLVAVFLLVGIYYYSKTSPEFNDNVSLIALWSLSCLLFYNAIKRQKLTTWVLVGVVAGFAMMAKYYTAILLLTLFIFLITNKDARKSFSHSGLYIAAFIFLLIISPNLYSLYEYHFTAFGYAINRGQISEGSFNKLLPHLSNPYKFFRDQLGVILPAIIILFFSFRQKPKREISGFDWHYILFITFSPLLFTILFSAVTGSHIKLMWGMPLFNFFGLFLVAWMAPEITLKNFKRFLLTTAFFFILGLIAYSWSNTVKPYKNHSGGYEFFPGEALSHYVTQEWHDKYNTPLKYVAGSRFLVMNIANYSKDKPIAYFSWSTKHSQWVNEKKLRENGAVFVWAYVDSKPGLPRAIKSRFPRVTDIHVKSFHWAVCCSWISSFYPKATIPPVKVNIAFLPPEQSK